MLQQSESHQSAHHFSASTAPEIAPGIVHANLQFPELIDVDAFANTPLAKDPYDHIVVPHFVPAHLANEVAADFPNLQKSGSYPLDAAPSGPLFKQLIDEFRRPEIALAFSKKFGVDVTDKPLMVTVRGFMSPRDGRIHTDTDSKIITALIYMNETWNHEGGRLRILRDGKNLENSAGEVAPMAGTLLAFRRGEASWHGHKPYQGVRRSIQLNWLTNEAAKKHHLGRHGFSAMVKNVQQFFGHGSIDSNGDEY